MIERPATKREERRLSRKVGYQFFHNRGPRIYRCHRRFCFTCWRDMLLGRHRRNKAAMLNRFAEERARVAACVHEWEEVKILDRTMPRCKKCRTTKWVRTPEPSPSPPPEQ